MVVLIYLSQCIANLQVGFVVSHPMFFAAIYRNTAVWALKVDMRRGKLGGIGGLSQRLSAL